MIIIFLHEYVHVFLQLHGFLIQKQVWYPPYGKWEHMPAHVTLWVMGGGAGCMCALFHQV